MNLFGVHIPVLWQTVVLLALSNVFMNFAWYSHLKHLNEKPWWFAALISWGIALFEYLLQVPANRIGHTEMSLGQLKILQEVITLAVFVPFVVFIWISPSSLTICGPPCVSLAPFISFSGLEQNPPCLPKPSRAA